MTCTSLCMLSPYLSTEPPQISQRAPKLLPPSQIIPFHENVKESSDFFQRSSCRSGTQEAMPWSLKLHWCDYHSRILYCCLYPLKEENFTPNQGKLQDFFSHILMRKCQVVISIIDMHLLLSQALYEKMNTDITQHWIYVWLLAKHNILQWFSPPICQRYLMIYLPVTFYSVCETLSLAIFLFQALIMNYEIDGIACLAHIKFMASFSYISIICQFIMKEWMTCLQLEPVVAGHLKAHRWCVRQAFLMKT